MEARPLHDGMSAFRGSLIRSRRRKHVRHTTLKRLKDSHCLCASQHNPPPSKLVFFFLNFCVVVACLGQNFVGLLYCLRYTERQSRGLDLIVLVVRGDHEFENELGPSSDLLSLVFAALRVWSTFHLRMPTLRLCKPCSALAYLYLRRSTFVMLSYRLQVKNDLHICDCRSRLGIAVLCMDAVPDIAGEPWYLRSFGSNLGFLCPLGPVDLRLRKFSVPRSTFNTQLSLYYGTYLTSKPK